MNNTLEGGATVMENVVTSIGTAVSADNLWGIVGNIVPILAISVLFGLGFYLVKRIINKIKRAKGGM